MKVPQTFEALYQPVAIPVMYSHNTSSNKFSQDQQFKARLYKQLHSAMDPWSVGKWPAAASRCFVDFLQSETCWHSANGTEPVASTNTTQQCTQYRPNGTLGLRHIQLLCVLCASAC